MLAALTGCINTAVSASAVASGIELSRLETRVRIAWDPFVFLHLRDSDEEGRLVNQFRDLRVELVVEGSAALHPEVGGLQPPHAGPRQRAGRRACIFRRMIRNTTRRSTNMFSTDDSIRACYEGDRGGVT